MRILLPVAESVTDPAIDLHAFYGHDWLDVGGVRVNFIASVDGGATAGGTSRTLQTPGDNAVFATLRDLADVIVVGAATAAIEGYAPVALSEPRQRNRIELGLAPNPATAVLTASLELDLEAALFSAPISAPTIILTGSAAPLGRRTDVIDAAARVEPGSLMLLEAASEAGGGVNFASAMDELRGLGYRRILCEGGPRVFSSAILSGGVDELCLTISPMLSGPDGPRIVAGGSWPSEVLPQLRLTGLLTEDDALFCRYRLPK